MDYASQPLLFIINRGTLLAMFLILMFGCKSTAGARRNGREKNGRCARHTKKSPFELNLPQHHIHMCKKNVVVTLY
jgi:hypothetical protein